MISYRPDPRYSSEASMSYAALRQDYIRYIGMTDKEFLGSLVKALHFATYVCWVKEIPGQQVLADDGVIHELVHLLDEQVTEKRLARIREIFNRDCELA